MTTSGLRRGSSDRQAPPDAPPFAPLTLPGLSVLSLESLSDHFRRGRVPGSLDAIDGTGGGRILRLTGLSGREPLASIFRHLTGSAAFPWRGKRFKAHSRDQGDGINRFGLLREIEAFPFRVRIEPSALDGRPCVCLDYDLPANPRWIRGLRDELREVSHGLFLGPAFVPFGSARKPMLYFGVSLR